MVRSRPVRPRGGRSSNSASAPDQPSCSISIPLSQNLEKRLDQYLYIEPKTPIVDVPQVELQSLRDVFDRWRGASRAIALRPTSDARLDVMTKGVIAQDIFEIVVVRQGMRAWPGQPTV